MVGFIEGQDIVIGTPSVAELGIIDDESKPRKLNEAKLDNFN